AHIRRLPGRLRGSRQQESAHGADSSPGIAADRGRASTVKPARPPTRPRSVLRGSMGVSGRRFRQYDIRGIVGEDLTARVAHGLGRAFAAHMARKGVRGAVAVGRDNRPSGKALRDALVRALEESGVNVVDVGVVPTPLLYWSLHNLPVV